MIPDSECLRIMTEILTELKLGAFKIKVSKRIGILQQFFIIYLFIDRLIIGRY